MRKIIAVMCVLLFCGTARGMELPNLGVCHGDNVRLRESPGTKGKVIGRADSGTQFIILGEAKSGGQKWYKIDHPAKKGSAYILAKYVNGWYNAGDIALGEVFAEVRLKFGITPDKTRALLGRPDNVQAEDEFMRFAYPGLDIDFEEETLSYVHIYKRGFTIGGIEFGDDARKLTRLGMPKDEVVNLRAKEYENWDYEKDGQIGAEGWSYMNDTGEQIFFGFKYDLEKKEVTIGSITWSRPIGEG